MFSVTKALGLGLLLLTSVSALGEDRCVGSRCISPAIHFDARYVCRATSYSGRGYPVSYEIGDRYICQDLGYHGPRFWPGGNYTGRYVCCYDPYYIIYRH